MLRLLAFFSLACFILACQTSLPEEVSAEYDNLPSTVDFNYHIKPILSDRCFHCHGPDPETRKANFRLDKEDEAYAILSDGQGRAFVRGNSLHSQALKWLISKDSEYQMPPPESKLKISNYEIALIAKWIDQGAKWKEHWSFTNPVRSIVPDETSDKWTHTNEIDNFIFQKIKEQNLSPSSQADKERLLRRVYLDITGLPPSIEAMNQWGSDASFEAYEQIVDKLLSSDAYAERMTMEWMDVARYADSHGLHSDGWRSMWPWRDWIIHAFKANMPYNQFATEQLAGDLLPNATKNQILATAFNRNHPMTAEGGAIDEEWRLNYVFDRTETVSTAFMGLTLGCAKCHDHKYDPFTQKEYYQLSSFFNNVKELGMIGDDGNFGPILLMSDSKTEAEISTLNDQIRAKEFELSKFKGDPDQLEKYITQLTDKPPGDLVGYFPLDNIRSIPGESRKEFDHNARSSGSINSSLVEGKYGNAVKFDADFSELRLEKIGFYELDEAFTVSTWIKITSQDTNKTQTIIGNSGEKNTFWRGWDFYLDNYNRLSTRIIHSLPHDYMHVRTSDAISLNEWTHVAFTYNGNSMASGISLFVNGVLQQKKTVYDRLYKTVLPVKVLSHALDERPLMVGKSGRNFTGENGIFRGVVDDIKIYSRALSQHEVIVASGIDRKVDNDILKSSAIKLSGGYQNIVKERQKLIRKRMSLLSELDEVMVMEESSVKRKSYAYHRGEYTSPMYEVGAETPELLLKFPEEAPKNRLGLAQWLFDSRHPLTARVAVNRYWQMIFGRGIVNTPEDFGVQGALPSHPELLDWLAVEFVESGWNVKELVKKMVLSATYRQSSVTTPENSSRDIANIYLARGSSYRLQAEIIRDNALAASGLLVHDIGGESVRPYQPEGLWIEKGNFSHKLLKYVESKGDSLYRRSLYTFLKRTSPHPTMTTFDAPPREVCTVKRESTNTPLQSLILLNDPQFVEAAKVLAERMQSEGGLTIDRQIAYGFRCATGRHPKASELKLLVQLFDENLKRYALDPVDAKSYLSVGSYEIDKHLDIPRTAALAIVANTVFNHDDTYMRR